MIAVRLPESIHLAKGRIEHGTFRGRWHFSFDDYRDPDFIRFGTLRVFNDDTLSAGAVWPLHRHREIEVVTYCAEGEFRHADERGKGGVLKQGWVQQTSVGSGMSHSEINNLPDRSMRFIQMWFMPSTPNLKPAVRQKPVEKAQRLNYFLPLVANGLAGALPIYSEAAVFSCSLLKGAGVTHVVRSGYGAYLYVLDGGPVTVSGRIVPNLGAAMISDEKEVKLQAEYDAELLLVEVHMMEDTRGG